jgi:prepilin-type N-terminal cleavage/methylation domain-containing protein
MKKLMLHKGFTLIEFVVIISIFAIMAGVALVNFSGFRSNVGLNNLAHDIALTIRQAQVFGWSTKTQNGVLDS